MSSEVAKKRKEKRSTITYLQHLIRRVLVLDVNISDPLMQVSLQEPVE